MEALKGRGYDEFVQEILMYMKKNIDKFKQFKDAKIVLTYEYDSDTVNAYFILDNYRKQLVFSKIGSQWFFNSSVGID